MLQVTPESCVLGPTPCSLRLIRKSSLVLQPWLPPPQSAAQAFKASKFDPTFESLPAAEQNQKRRLQQLQGLTGEGPAEQHCGLQRQTCEGPSAVSTKQRNQMQLMSTVTGVPVPSDTEVTSFVEANVWIRARWNEYMSHDRPAQ